jgi:hypothetical protein
MEHPFEAAGLGKAPYRFAGVTREVFQAIPGDPSCPVQAGASCDYCPAAIMFAFWFVSSDGQRFKVGCDCFRKANVDPKLARQVDAAVARLERQKREQRAARTAVRVTEEHAALLAELAGWREGFAGSFAVSLARQIRKGKRPTARQIALVARLRQEQAA